MKISLILTCAGKGSRAGFEKNKVFLPLGDTPVFLRALKPFIDCGLIGEYIIAASKDDFEAIKSLSPDFCKIVLGGATRTQSVKNALLAVTGDIVLIHDGARPFVTETEIISSIESVKKYRSGIAAIKSKDTVYLADGEYLTECLGKETVYSVQTPQGFFTEDIKRAYELKGDREFPDDGSVYMEYIGKPKISKGSYDNIKLTYKEDFKEDLKVGVGFDCHELVAGRKLILGGVDIPFDKGLKGHSDADALTHAVMDAILSALALRDIGYHFPDGDPKYRDISSMVLLDEVLKMAKEKGYGVKNISAVIMAEKPKLSPYIDRIAENLASAVGVNANCVGIGATTLEGLGFVGREEGICVHASCLMVKI